MTASEREREIVARAIHQAIRGVAPDDTEWDDLSADEEAYCYAHADIIRAALRSEPQPSPAKEEERDGWRPIETAPKDGTRVLILHSGDGVCDGAFYQAGTESDDYAPAGWYAYGVQRHPSHWMPLPSGWSTPDDR